MLAEIADKMPSLEKVWAIWIVIGLLMALTTAILSAIRLWAGGVIAILCLVLGFLATASGGMMDDLIVRELGIGYLIQQRIAGFVPFALSAAAWLIVRYQRPGFRAEEVQ